MDRVRVKLRIPAVALNLGAGYSSLGMALSLHNEFTVEEAEEGLQVTNGGAYGRDIPVTGANLAVRAAQKLFERVGYPATGLRVVAQCNVPPRRGLASSATAVVAGLVAANRIARASLDRAEICALAGELDERPEAAAAALLGGVTLTLRDHGGPVHLKLPFPEGLRMLLSIPEIDVSAKEARVVWPKQVSVEDAVFNCGRAAMFVASLFTGEDSCFALGLEDRLHFPHLKKTIPALQEISLIASGGEALGCSICGYGSSFLIFHRGDGVALADRVRATFKRYRVGVRIMNVEADRSGTEIRHE